MDSFSIELRSRSIISINSYDNVVKVIIDNGVDIAWENLDDFHETRELDIETTLSNFKEKVPPLIYNYWKNKLENKLNMSVEKLCCFLSHEQFNLIKDE